MRLFIYLLLGTSLLLVGIWIHGTGGSDSLHDNQYSFGNVKAGTKVDHVFAVTNTGSSPWEVDKIVTSCGCTTGKIADVIPSGASVQMPVTVEFPDNDQDVRSDIRIMFKNRPPLDFRITGHAVRIVPRGIDLGVLRRGEPGSRSFRVRAARDGPCTITRVDVDKKLFDVSYSVCPDTPTETLVNVQLASDAGVGRLATNLQITTSSRTDPIMVVPITVRVLRFAELRRTLMAVDLGSSHRHEDVLTIDLPYKDSVRIVGVTVSDPAVLTCETSGAIFKGDSIALPFTISGDFARTIFKGSIQLKLECQGERLDLPAEIYAKKAGGVAVK